MTKPKRPPRWHKPFLEELAATSNVTASARKARIGLACVYYTRRTNPDFARAWQDALCEGYDLLEMSLLERMRGGEPADRGARHENATALRLLAHHRDNVKRERGRRQMADQEAIYASIRGKIATIQAREAAFAQMLAKEAHDQATSSTAAG